MIQLEYQTKAPGKARLQTRNTYTANSVPSSICFEMSKLLEGSKFKPS